MEFHEIMALFDYWKKDPPTHILVQGFFKMGGGESKPGEINDEQFEELASYFPIR